MAKAAQKLNSEAQDRLLKKHFWVSAHGFVLLAFAVNILAIAVDMKPYQKSLVLLSAVVGFLSNFIVYYSRYIPGWQLRHALTPNRKKVSAFGYEVGENARVPTFDEIAGKNFAFRVIGAVGVFGGFIYLASEMKYDISLGVVLGVLAGLSLSLTIFPRYLMYSLGLLVVGVITTIEREHGVANLLRSLVLLAEVFFLGYLILKHEDRLRFSDMKDYFNLGDNKSAKSMPVIAAILAAVLAYALTPKFKPMQSRYGKRTIKVTRQYVQNKIGLKSSRDSNQPDQQAQGGMPPLKALKAIPPHMVQQSMQRMGQEHLGSGQGQMSREEIQQILKQSQKETPGEAGAQKLSYEEALDRIKQAEQEVSKALEDLNQIERQALEGQDLAALLDQKMQEGLKEEFGEDWQGSKNEFPSNKEKSDGRSSVQQNQGSQQNSNSSESEVSAKGANSGQNGGDTSNALGAQQNAHTSQNGQGQGRQSAQDNPSGHQSHESQAQNSERSPQSKENPTKQNDKLKPQDKKIKPEPEKKKLPEKKFDKKFWKKVGVIALICLGFAALVFVLVKYAGKKKPETKDKKRPVRDKPLLNSNEAIYQLNSNLQKLWKELMAQQCNTREFVIRGYNALLKFNSDIGLNREIYDTPDEYLLRQIAFAPKAAKESSTIARTFNKVMYSNFVPTPEVVQEYVQAIQKSGVELTKH